MNEFLYEKEADVSEYVYLQKYQLNRESYMNVLPHYHNSIEFTLVVKGNYTSYINGVERILQQGDMVFVDSLIPHFYKISGVAEVYAVVINLATFKTFGVEGTFPCYIKNRPLFDKLLPLCEAAKEKWERANLQFKTGFAHVFLGTVLQEITLEKADNSKSRAAFLEIMRYIEEHYREDITLEYLAQKFGYAPNYFSRMFNKFAGIGLREYVNRLRIAEALKIKKQAGNISWRNIAERVGYTSLNTFFRAYAKYAARSQTENGS
ncbi:MAG: AraC family transcriptional regulator [Clostridia bacterium]|nr:AraC family transcriptional regulator [Clostridia bacterium]